jgi:hypothetical protein
MTVTEFLKDKRGKRFSDVVKSPGIPFEQTLALLSKPETLRRMEESEELHGHAAFVGCVKELEALPDVKRYFETTNPHLTIRYRQAVGTAVWIQMEKRGWTTTGRKMRLGKRDKGLLSEGKYENEKNGFARWFLTAEHYVRKITLPS